MTVIEFPDVFGRPEFRRKQGGAPIVKMPNGDSTTYRRPSSYARPIEDAFHLEKWRKRIVAHGAALLDHPAASAEHRAAAQALRDLDPNDKADRDQADRLAELAFERGGGSERANAGTAMHTIIEAYNRGTLDTDGLSEAEGADVEAFGMALVRHGLTVDPDRIEHHVVCDEMRAAGTLDFVATTVDGRRFVCDLKTGGSLDLAQVGYAVQLAIYARGVTYDVVEERRGDPLGVSQEWALIFHLPLGSGYCTVLAIDIAAGWQGAMLAAEAKRWHYRKDLLQPFPEDQQLTLAVDTHPSNGRRMAADGKPAPARIEPLPRPAWARPDDGRDIDRDHGATAIRAGFARLDVRGGRIDAIEKWRDESRAVGRSFSFDDKPCERTRDIYRAVARLAAYCVEVDGDIDEVLVRTLLHVVLGEEVQPATTIGAAIGSLTIAEATSLRHVCDLLLDGGRLVFEDDGAPAVTS